MPRDNKYGDVTLQYPPTSIPEDVLRDMPSCTFLAKDVTSVPMLHKAITVAKHAGADEAHLALLRKTAAQFEAWQGANSQFLKVPDSDGPTADEIEMG